MKNALIIFVRKPEAGKVKTRLAATLGDEKALDIYRQLLQHTFNVASETVADKFVFYAGEIESHDLWNAEGFYKRLQSDQDLGHKMKTAFEEIFREDYKKVVIIGSDCFELTADMIAEAFVALDKTDMVIGPANDGGYYLLGMKELRASLFENKQWSTESVFGDTVGDFKNYGLSFTTLALLTDVDTEEDWLATKP
jgi:uncharacterized protein